MRCIKDESESVLVKEEELNRWVIYFEDLLKVEHASAENYDLKFSHVQILGPKFFLLYLVFMHVLVVSEVLLIFILTVVPLLCVTSMSLMPFIKDISEFCT